MLKFLDEHIILETIEKLNDDNLFKLSDEEVIKELLKFKNLGLALTKIQKGDLIYRVRIKDQDKLYSNISDFNYRTDCDNIKSYGRANLKFNSMFYGSVYGATGILNKKAQLTPYIEVLSILHDFEDKSIKHEFFYTSEWEVKEDFEIVAIINDERFHQNNEAAKYLASKYNESLKELNEEAPKLRLMIDFIAKQYSREVKKEEDWKYKISANYTQYLLSKELAGVIYPSVKTAGESFNIAIHPTIADQFLDVKHVAYCESYIKDKDVIMGYNLIGRVTEPGNIIWEDTELNSKLGNIDVKRFYKKHGVAY